MLHQESLTSQDMTRYLKQHAVCVINCSWDVSELEKQLPAKMRKDLAEKQAVMANVAFFDSSICHAVSNVRCRSDRQNFDFQGDR